MGAELEEDTRKTSHAHPGDATAQYQMGVPQHHDGYVLPKESNVAPPEAVDHAAMSSGSRITLLLVGIILAFFIFVSARPFYTLLFVFLALLPAFPIIHYIRSKLQDNAINWTYLLNQFLLGAIPLLLFTMIVEWIFTFAIGSLIFRGDLPDVENAMDAPPPEGDDSKSQDQVANLLDSIPLWKLILFFLLIAFVTAGFVEEVAKWMLARRYRKVDDQNAQLDANSGARIGCKGILAIACMGSLGFAASENMGYVLAITASSRAGFSFGLVGISLLRGLLAYPLHMGAQFFVAVSAAQWYVFKDKSNVMSALLIAILFHGTFDGVALIGMVLIAAKKIPVWIGYVIPVFDVFIVGSLVLLCRARYKALLERERLVLASEPV